MTEISKLEREVRDLLSDPNIPADHRREAQERLEAISGKIEVLQSNESFRRFVRLRLSEEQDRFQNGDRETPLCSCSYPRCDLKQGKVPGLVDLKETPAKGVEAFRARHPDEIILTELTRDFGDMSGTVKSELQDIVIDLTGKANA